MGRKQKKAKVAVRRSRRAQGEGPEDFQDEVAQHVETIRRGRQETPAVVDVAVSQRSVGSFKTYSGITSQKTSASRKSQMLSDYVRRREAELEQLKELTEHENRAAAIRKALNVPEEYSDNDSQKLSDEEFEDGRSAISKSKDWLLKTRVTRSEAKLSTGVPVDVGMMGRTSPKFADVPSNAEFFQQMAVRSPGVVLPHVEFKESSNVDGPAVAANPKTDAGDILVGLTEAIKMLASEREPRRDDHVKSMIVRQAVGKQMPTYNGDPEEWPAFIEKYRRTTETCGFTDGENLDRLQRCLSGKAREAVKSMMIMPENVPAIMSTLERNFGRPDLIVQAMVKKARDMPSVMEGKPQSLMDLANAVQNVVTTVVHLKKNMHLQNPELLNEIANKLPESERCKWAEEKLGKEDVDLVEFSAWLDKRAMVANELRVMRPEHKEKRGAAESKTGFGKQHPNKKFDQRRPQVVCASTARKAYADPPFTNAKECTFCKKQGHIVTTCRRFLGLNVDNRWRWAREKNACYCCLENTHRLNKCQNQTECGTDGCPRWHHRYLHPPGWKPIDDGPTEKNYDEQVNVVGHIKEVKVARRRVLLRVLPVVLQGPKGEIHNFALLDEASTTTIIDADLAKKLGAKGESIVVENQWYNGKSCTKTTNIINIKIANPRIKRFYRLDNVQTDDEFHLPLQTIDAKSMVERWPHLKGFTHLSYENARPKILIGQNDIELIVPTEVVRGPWNSPVASRCLLGWALHGKTYGQVGRVDRNFTLHVFRKEEPVGNGFQHGGELSDASENEDMDSLHQLVKQQFSTESFGVKVKEEYLITNEDKRVLHLAKTTTRKIEGRWETGLLWNKDEIHLPPSKRAALQRLRNLERKMDRNKEYGGAYCNQMQDFLDKGYARKLTDREAIKEGPKTWYLPHFGHVNPNKPGKIRLVFDAAAKSNNVSLNDHLLKGMNLVTSLPICLFGFREKAIGFVGDIKEMFPQVKIKEEDRQAQRFLYRGMDRSRPPDVYEMQVMIFGSASSPYSAQYVKNINADCHQEEFPCAAKAIKEKHYVDDYLDSVDTEEEAVRLISEVHEVHSRGGFKIVNFMCSSPQVLASLPKDIVAERHKDLALEDEYPVERVLGLYWDAKMDCFSFRTSFKKFRPEVMSGESCPTKREMLAIVMTVYDPLGFISHYTIKARILLQDVWRCKIDWDDELPEELFEKWKLWLEELSDISQVKIPRCYTPRMTGGDVQLHGFVDASEEAFSAVAYFRVEIGEDITTSLIMAKAKVSPLKRLSVPKLELQAAVLGTRMSEAIRSGHSVKANSTHYWSDSSTVLSWLRTDTKRLPVFVAHRVGEVVEMTDVKEWHWIPTKENVADEATRSGTPTEFSPTARWFTGPKFLKKDKSHWPKELSEKELLSKVRKEELEIKEGDVGVIKSNPPFIDWSRYSSWSRAKRTAAYVLRFVQLCRKKKMERVRDTTTLPLMKLTTEELEKAEVMLLRCAQKESFREETATLTKGKMVLRSSRVVKLSPMMDDRGLIVIRGRTINSPEIGAEAKCPIILDPRHPSTTLIIHKYHHLSGHHGTERVLNELRQRFWVIEGRSAVQKVGRDCLRCKVEKAKPAVPEMAALPEFRLTKQIRPFMITGLDYFGPMTVTIGRRHEKRYGALFTCLTTRAVHMEIADSLSTDSAIMALRRFIARRGCPAELYSDNGTNFHGANNELKKAMADINRDEIAAELAEKGIRWLFIPPGAPHMGGAWERMVRSIKTALHTTLKDQTPKEEVLLTLMAEAEHTVNSRPLTRVSGDPDDMESLTPNHFLLGSSSGVHQWGEFDKADLCLRKQWRTSQALADQFWRRWIREYVPTLTIRSKWHQPRESVKVGDLVFIVDENSPRNAWIRGKITATHPGKDGEVRVVDVKTSQAVYRRPVAKIAVLDVLEEGERIDPEPNSGGENVATQAEGKTHKGSV